MLAGVGFELIRVTVPSCFGGSNDKGKQPQFFPYIEEEFPHGHGSEQSKIHLSQNFPAAAARTGSPREEDPQLLNFF